MLINGLPLGLEPPKNNGSVQRNSNYSSKAATSASTNRHTSPQNNHQTKRIASESLADGLDKVERARRLSPFVEHDTGDGEAYRYAVNPRATRALAAYDQTTNFEKKDQFARMLGIDVYV